MLLARGRREERLSDTLLACLLFLNAVKIAYWMLGFAGWYDSHDAFTSFMFYFPFNNVIWMGPLLYFYFLSLTNASFRFNRSHYRHFVLPVMFLLLILAKFIIDFGVYHPFPVEENTQYGTKGPLADLDKNIWTDLLCYASFFYYLFITIRDFGRYQQYVKQNFSNTEAISFSWLRKLLYAISAGVIVFFIFSAISHFAEIRRGYVFEWYSYMTLGIIIYYLSIAGYFVRPVQIQQLHFIPAEAATALPEITTKPAGFENEKQQLLALMETGKPYLEPDLTLSQLAKQLHTNPSLLSKMINTGTGQNFNDFINEYRVDAVIEKLKAGEQKTQTLLGIAYDSGFNSKATFNRAFKKHTGLSPKEWLQQNKLV